MSLSAAVTQLNTWTPTGIANLGYHLSSAPTEADLPALVVDFSPDVDFVEGFESLNVAADAGTVTFMLAHVLLIEGISVDLPDNRQSGVLLHVDNYLATAAGDLLLDGNLRQPLTIVGVQVRPIEWLGVVYWGVRFIHRWELEIDGV